MDQSVKIILEAASEKAKLIPGSVPSKGVYRNGHKMNGLQRTLEKQLMKAGVDERESYNLAAQWFADNNLVGG